MKITDKKKVQKVVQAINGIIDLTGRNIIDVTLREGKTMKAPEWFKEFEKKNDARWDKNDERWDKNDKRWDQQIEFNNNVSKFMESQMDFNSKIMLRLDNIVSKNNLTE